MEKAEEFLSDMFKPKIPQFRLFKSKQRTFHSYQIEQIPSICPQSQNQLNSLSIVAASKHQQQQQQRKLRST